MNREEFATKVQDLVNQAYLHDIDNKYYKGMMYEAEKLRYPITLAEFLGWEEGTKYKIEGNSLIYTVSNDTLWLFDEYGKLRSTSSLDMDSTNIRKLRSAKKVEPKKYYAKIKGWELIPSDYYYFGLDDNHDLEIKDACDAYEFTKREWADLGINDDNADFEGVEDLNIELSEVVSEKK